MKNQIKTNNKIFIYLVIAVLVGVLVRTVFKISPGFEIITALSVGAGYFFQKKILAFLVPLIIMLISDLLIGNTNIYLFTWTGFLVAPLLGLLFAKIGNKSLDSLTSYIVRGMGAGVIAVIIHFLWTNLGVVLTTTMYSKNFEGLIQSYINSLPFLKNQLLSTVIFVPLVFTLVIVLLNKARQENYNNKF